ncbi:MAG: hypothetical protein DRP56_01380 [Planctomycetota bacterium]|nr:MAG: hypothetical protein DRP56_01380 [Planctomycetota bacterium]
MTNKDEKLPTVSFYPCIILTVIASISFVVINPVFGIIAGVLAWLSYKKTRKEISTQQKTSPKAAVNEGTKKLIGTLITEQETRKEKPFEYRSYLIRRGSLPPRIHDILDEMEITTWLQLSLLDEKELLYEKCFGQEALRNLKAELAKRGFTFDGSTPRTDL